MGTREGMIKQFEKALGFREPNEVHRWYAERNGSYFGRGSTPWCDMTVTWSAALSGNYDAVCFGKDYAYTVWHAQIAQKHNRWHYDVAGIKRGDILFFDWDGTNTVGKIDHVGIVTDVRGSAIYTIEGNTANTCARRVRYASSIVGYIRPSYDGAGESSGSARVFQRGDEGQDVRDWQADLTRVGLPVGEQDPAGRFGDDTDRLTREFQKWRGITVDGEVGPQSKTAMANTIKAKQKYKKSTPAPALPRVTVPLGDPQLKRGSTGTRTRQLQDALNAWRGSLKLAEDGKFGSKTEEAVRTYQRSAKITVDGVYGKQTAGKLKATLR